MIADFLTAALVTLLLPIAALVLLIVWRAVVAHRASRRKVGGSLGIVIGWVS